MQLLGYGALNLQTYSGKFRGVCVCVRSRLSSTAIVVPHTATKPYAIT